MRSRNAYAAFAFLASALLPASAQTTLHTVAGSTGEEVGLSFALGDVNADGVDDVIIGSVITSNSAGTVRVLDGSDGQTPIFTAFGPPGTQFGFAVAAGDVDADGYAEVIVGAPTTQNGLGAVHVYSGFSSTLSGTPVYQYSPIVGTGGPFSPTLGGLLGYSVAYAADVDGDQQPDILAGAPSAPVPVVCQSVGLVHIYNGALGGASGSVHQVGQCSKETSFGIEVESMGDIDGDGLTDVAVGWRMNNGSWRLDLLPGDPMRGLSVSSLGGWSDSKSPPVAADIGDLDEDGVDDVLIGWPLSDGAVPDSGRAELWLSVAGGPVYSLDATFDGRFTGESFGYSVSAAGDVNADTNLDFVIGAPALGATASDGGSVHVYSGLVYEGKHPTLYSLTGGTGEMVGRGVGAAPDVNGDGWGEIVASGRLVPGMTNVWQAEIVSPIDPTLNLDVFPKQIQAGVGDVLNFSINPGAIWAGDDFWLFGSLFPLLLTGLPLDDGSLLWLDPNDPFYWYYSFFFPNQPPPGPFLPYFNNLGTLDAQGRAKAYIVLPGPYTQGIPSLPAGFGLHHQYVVIDDPTGTPSTAAASDVVTPAAD